MKNFHAVLPASVMLSMLVNASLMFAGPIHAPTSATANVPLDSRTSATRLIDHSGLSATYVSGVTDFAAFTSTATHDADLGNTLRTEFSPTPVFPVVLTFDLGAAAPQSMVWRTGNVVLPPLKT